MDAYVRVDKKRDEGPIQENEVRIMASNKMRNYISYAISLLTDKGHTSVQLKAMGRAINKTVAIAEIIKRRIKDLHQLTEVGSVNITDTWEPKEEGLNRLEITRHVSIITITLSTTPLDTSHPGYQPPLDSELVKPPQDDETLRRPRSRRPGKDGRGDQAGAPEDAHDDLIDALEREEHEGGAGGYGGGRGGGRGGRGGRGGGDRGRGGRGRGARGGPGGNNRGRGGRGGGQQHGGQRQQSGGYASGGLSHEEVLPCAQDVTLPHGVPHTEVPPPPALPAATEPAPAAAPVAVQ